MSCPQSRTRLPRRWKGYSLHESFFVRRAYPQIHDLGRSGSNETESQFASLAQERLYLGLLVRLGLLQKLYPRR